MGSIRTIVDDLRNCWQDLLVFEILFKILQTAVLTPLLAWMVATLINSTGRLAITNTEIASFFLSPAGLFLLFLGAAFGITSVYVEQAGIMILAWGRITGSRVSGAAALMGSVRRIPLLLMLGGRQLGILLLWLGPLAAAGAASCWLLLSGHDINYYLAQRPPEFVWASTIVALLAVLATLVFAWFLIRWVFAVPQVLFCGQRPGEALRRSARMVRGAYLDIGGTVLACLGVMVLLPAILTWLVNLLDVAVFAVVGENVQLAILAAGALLVLHGLVLAAASTVSLSVYVLVVTRLYARRSGSEGVLQGPAETQPAEGRATGVRPPRLARILVTSATALAVASAVGTYLIAEQLDFQYAVEITAHRGHSTAAPENTRSALRKAIESEADYAEIDVQLTADEVVVVIHDADLMRIAGDGRRISETSYADLKAVDAGSWFSPKFAGERIPSLDEAIAEARGRIKLNLELKPKGDDRRLARKVVETIRRQRFESQCVITSLDHGELLEVKRLAPELKTGFIVARAAGRVFDLEADFLSVNSAMVDSELMTDAKRARKDVHVWTVNDPRQMSAMIDRGVKNVITDEVDVLVALRKELSELNDGERIILAFRNWMRQ